MAEPLQMGGGQVVFKLPDGTLFNVPDTEEEIERALTIGASAATPEEVNQRNEYLKYADQTGQGLAESVIRTSPIGPVFSWTGFDSDEENRARARVTQERHPILTGGAEFIGETTTQLAGELVASPLKAIPYVGPLAAQAVGGSAAGMAGEYNRAFVEDRDPNYLRWALMGAGSVVAGRGIGYGARKLMGKAAPLVVKASQGRRVVSEGVEFAETPLARMEQESLELQYPRAWEAAGRETLDNADDVARVARQAPAIRTQAAEEAAQHLDQATKAYKEVVEQQAKAIKSSDLADSIVPQQTAVQVAHAREVLPGLDAMRTAAQGTGLEARVAKFAKSYQAAGEATIDAASKKARFDALVAQKLEGEAFQRELTRAVKAGGEEAAMRLGPLRESVAGALKPIRTVLTNESLWGKKAAGYQRALGAIDAEADEAMAAVQQALGKNPKAALAKLLKGPEEELQAFRGQLQQATEAQRKVAGVAKEYGTLTEVQAGKAGKALDDVQTAFGRAEKASWAERTVAGAKAQLKAKEGKGLGGDLGAAAGAMLGGYFGGVEGAMAGQAVGRLVGGGSMKQVAQGALERVPFVGRAVEALDLVDKTAKWLTKVTAQTMVGSKAGGQVLQGMAKAGTYATSAGMRSIYQRMSQPSQVRFQEDYDTLQQAYQEKAGFIRDAMQNPGKWMDALTEDLAWAAAVDPRLQASLAQRNTEALRYLAANLPPAIRVSMLNPKGSPPPTSEIRKFAQVYSAVVEPHTVLGDLQTGRATRAQMDALEAVHPELYDALLLDVFEAVSSSPVALSPNRKAMLNILFKGQAPLGPSYNSSFALLIDEAGQMAKGPEGQASPEPGLSTQTATSASSTMLANGPSRAEK